MFPLISVIVPVYNHAGYVNQTLLRILQQSYPNIELIVLNDGSTDNSDEVIKSLLSCNEFYYEHHENMGLAATLRKGVSLASGRYIALVASDDYWDLNIISKQYKYMIEHNSQACIAYHHDINESNEISYRSKCCEGKKYYFNDIMTSGADLPRANILIDTNGVDNFLQVFDSDFPVEDVRMWCELTKNGGHIDVMPEVLAYYRIHPENSTNNKVWLFQGIHKVIDQYMDMDIYSKAKIKWSLMAFRQLAGLDKFESLKYIIWTPKFIFSPDFLVGCLKLLFKWQL